MEENEKKVVIQITPQGFEVLYNNSEFEIDSETLRAIINNTIATPV